MASHLSQRKTKALKRPAWSGDLSLYFSDSSFLPLSYSLTHSSYTFPFAFPLNDKHVSNLRASASSFPSDNHMALSLISFRSLFKHQFIREYTWHPGRRAIIIPSKPDIFYSPYPALFLLIALITIWHLSLCLLCIRI